MKIILCGLIGGLIFSACSVPSSGNNSYDFNLVSKIQSANIKNISMTSSVAAIELDKECNHPVESFSMVDSAMTIGTLFAKSKLSDTFSNNNSKSTLETIKNGAKQINWLPIEVEMMLSEKSHNARKDILPREKNKKDYEKAERIVNKILATVKEEHDYNFKIFVIRGSAKAALASPGGYIYITKSALKEEEYAIFAIAHEISHSLKRHETMAVQSMLIDGVQSMDELSGILKNPKDNISKIMSKVLVTKMFFMKFHEDHELTADACGMSFIKQAYPEQSSIIARSYLKTLPDKQTASNNAAKNVFDILQASIQKHPSSKERKSHLILMINKRS